MAGNISLASPDGGIHTLPKGAVVLAAQLNKLIKDLDESAPFPVPVGDNQTLGKVVAYLTYHFEHPLPPSSQHESFKGIEEWDKTFVAENEASLSNIIEVADFLQIHDLLSLASSYIGDKIKSLTVEQIREQFGLEANLTEDDLAAIKKEDEEAFPNEDD